MGTSEAKDENVVKTFEEKTSNRVYTLLGYMVLGVIAFVVITGTKIKKI